MSKLFVYASSKASIEKAQELSKKERSLRKASFEMTLAFQCLQNILPQIELLQEKLGASDISFVCGTSHGSLYATKDFLKGLSELKRARPFLFQNSLHNSITGFLCQQFKLKGPSFTVSKVDQTGESCLELAKDLIESKTSKACIVLSVDGLVPDFKETLQSYVPGVELTEGAGALIVSNKDLGALPLQASVSLTENTKTTKAPPSQKAYYDADCIETVATAIQEGTEEVSRFRPTSKKTSLIKLNLF